MVALQSQYVPYHGLTRAEFGRPDHFFTVNKALGNSAIKNLYIQNYPTHCFSITNSAGLLLENIVLNNAAGNAPNARSGGLPAAHNTGESYQRYKSAPA